MRLYLDGRVFPPLRRHELTIGQRSVTWGTAWGSAGGGSACMPGVSLFVSGMRGNGREREQGRTHDQQCNAEYKKSSDLVARKESVR